MGGHYEVDPDTISDGVTIEEIEEVKLMFSNVWTSMFFLFETMSSWSLMPLIPLFDVSLAYRLFFSLFYIYAGWILLAVMTGTVSFTMITMKEKLVAQDGQSEQDKRNYVSDMIRDIFLRL